MSENIHKILEALDKISADIASSVGREISYDQNAIKRRLYQNLEYLRMDFDDLNQREQINEGTKTLVYEKFKILAKSLIISPIKPARSIYSRIDSVTRLLAFPCFVMLCGSFGSLLTLLLLGLDSILSIDMPHMMSQKLRRLMFQGLLITLGVNYEIQGLSDKIYEYNCIVMPFSHASNLDPFLILATLPIRLASFAKKELFLIPFFAWGSFAYGGVPLDRQNRDRAIAALRTTAERNKNTKLGFMIAPEGSRSTTGQLLAFKKGAFHLTKDLKSPLMPIVFLGAYELWPRNDVINMPGNVVIKYLDPIPYDAVSSLDEMSALVRRKMLTALSENPPIISQPLSLTNIIASWIVRSALIVAASFTFKVLNDLRNVLHLPVGLFLVYVSLICIAITLGLFIYFVYIATPTENKSV